MLRSAPRPDLGWGRPIASVMVAVFVPALIAGAGLWLFSLEIGQITSTGLRMLWFVAASLMAAPLLSWLIVPLMSPLVRIAAKRGWAGPASLVILALIIGLPLAHVMLNGDLTNEAPEMIPVLVIALSIQAFSGWLILRGSRKAKIKDISAST